MVPPGASPLTRLDAVVTNRLGLHARAAARFVHVAHAFASRIRVAKDGVEVDGKSILGLLTLAAPKGARLAITIEGPDEPAAAETIGNLVGSGFGEAD